jgi:hypothetical protein
MLTARGCKFLPDLEMEEITEHMENPLALAMQSS